MSVLQRGISRLLCYGMLLMTIQVTSDAEACNPRNLYVKMRMT